MRRLSLPPVGALTHVDQLRPGDSVYLVSPSPRDTTLTFLTVSKYGVSIHGTLTPLLRGLHLVQRREAYPIEFYPGNLNLAHDGTPHGNDYNDAYLFRNYDLAVKYSEFCMESPDKETLHDYPDGRRRNRSVMQGWQVSLALSKEPVNE